MLNNWLSRAEQIYAAADISPYGRLTPERYRRFLTDGWQEVAETMVLLNSQPEEIFREDGRLLSPVLPSGLHYPGQPPIVVDLTGMPGTGKTVVLGNLQSEFPLDLYLVPDRVQQSRKDALRREFPVGGSAADFQWVLDLLLRGSENAIFTLIDAIDAGGIPRLPIISERSFYNHEVMRRAKSLAGLIQPTDEDLDTNFSLIKLEADFWKGFLPGSQPIVWLVVNLHAKPETVLQRKHRGEIISPEFLPVMFTQFARLHEHRLTQFNPTYYYLSLDAEKLKPGEIQAKVLQAVEQVRSECW